MTDVSCIVCQREGRIPSRPPVCEGCRSALASMLREIPTLYARLDPRPGQSNTERVSGSRVPPVPLNIDVADLTDAARPASIGVKHAGHWASRGGDPDQIGHLSVATILDHWVRDWINHNWCPGDHLPAPTVSTLAAWLEVRLDDACDNHPAIDEFAADIRRIHGTIKRMVGELKAIGERIGHCPAILRDGTRCNTTLRADPYVSQVACPRCRTSWPSWLALAAAMQDDEKGGEAA